MFLRHLELCAIDMLAKKEENNCEAPVVVTSQTSPVVTGLMAFSLVHLFHVHTVRNMYRFNSMQSFENSFNLVFAMDLLDDANIGTTSAVSAPVPGQVIIHVEALDFHSLKSTFGRYLNVIQCDCMVLATEQPDRTRVTESQVNIGSVPERLVSEMSPIENFSSTTTAEASIQTLSSIIEKAGMAGLALSEAKARFIKHIHIMETDEVTESLFEYSLTALLNSQNPSVIRLKGPTRMVSHLNSEFTKSIDTFRNDVFHLVHSKHRDLYFVERQHLDSAAVELQSETVPSNVIEISEQECGCPWVTFSGALNVELLDTFRSSVLSYLGDHPGAPFFQLHAILNILTQSQSALLLDKLELKECLIYSQYVMSDVTLVSPWDNHISVKRRKSLCNLKSNTINKNGADYTKKYFFLRLD